MLIESSKDLLFVILAFSVLWLTVFISWLLYYVITIVRDAESLVRQIRKTVERVEAVAQSAHEKMERSAASFTLVAQAVKELISWGIQQRANKKPVKPKSKK
jgi:predicted PurR-regulated permease PerM